MSSLIHCQFCSKMHRYYVTCIPFRDWVRAESKPDKEETSDDDNEPLFV